MKEIFSILSQFKYTLIGWLLAICFLIGMCFSIRSCYNANQKANNNVISLTDTIKFYKSKTGDLVASKTLLEGDLSTLKLVNDSLYNVLKDIKVTNPSTVINVKGAINNGKNDTVWVVKQDTRTPDTIINIRKDFAFNNEYRSLEGYVSVSDSILGLNIEKDKVYFDYVAAIQDNKVYITSNNPYVTYEKITGITIPNTKKKWSVGVGPHIGYGYNFVAKQFNPYIGLGISIQYNLLSW